MKASFLEILRNNFAKCDDACIWISDKVYLFQQRWIPSVIPFRSGEVRLLDEHGALGHIGNVVTLVRLAKISACAEVKDEVFY
ncbi:MAG TPA: hypothetical protein DEP84_31305 [Chloroflexi bacterium]|nr:hypothetical protein [Chloroflexota bacterium]